MNDEAGYTLAEALAALLILALAIGGLLEGGRLLAQAQRRTSEAVAEDHAMREAQAAFEAALSDRSTTAAVLEHRLLGVARALSFTCGERADCGVILEDHGDESIMYIAYTNGRRERWLLPRSRGAYLVYNSQNGSFRDWRFDDNHGLLRSIDVVRPSGGGDSPVLSARLWIEQSPICEFDTIAKTCRNWSP